MNAPAKIAHVSINAAIAAAMADIRPLAKDERNAHGNYNFAGIDAFLDLTRPICAKHGLTVLQDEEGFEVFDVPNKNGPQKMLLMRFAFTVQKDSESIGPLRRSIMVPASMGSQAFGSAQSYALKQFLRSLFQISTGEKDDIDAHDTGELANYSNKPEPKAKPENWGGRYPTKTALWAACKELHAKLIKVANQGTLDDMEVLTTQPEYHDFVAIASERFPWMLDGPAPEAMPEFVPIFTTEQKARDMIALRGNTAITDEELANA